MPDKPVTDRQRLSVSRPKWRENNYVTSGLLHRVQKKVLHFVFAHNFTKYKLDFVTVFSDRYWVVSLQVCHTARIISGLKYIFFAIKNVRVVRYPRIQHIHNLQKGHNYATAQRIFNWFCQSQITVSWRIHLRIFAESFIKFVRELLEI